MLHDQAKGFFCSKCPDDITLERAQSIAEHVATCVECAKLIVESPEHAKLLLAQMHARESPSEWAQQTAEDLGDERELSVFAEALERSLGQQFAKANPGLARGSEKWLELPNLSSASPLTYQLALVTAEACLALRSLATQESRILLGLDGTVVAGRSRAVPRAYFVGRVSEYSELPLKPANEAWGGLCDLTIRGKIGLPGLHQRESSDSSCLLVAEELKDVARVSQHPSS